MFNVKVVNHDVLSIIIIIIIIILLCTIIQAV